jgi:hypothetical protein
MLKQYIISETDNIRRSVIPPSLNPLYHFTDDKSVNKIIKSNELKVGTVNYGVTDMKYSKPKGVNSESQSISFTRNKLLFFGHITFGFIFDRKQLERFYKLLPVQPIDERDITRKMTGDVYARTVRPDVIRAVGSEWDEEVILKNVKNLDDVVYGMIVREPRVKQMESLRVIVEFMENDSISKIPIFIQSNKGVIYKKITTYQELSAYLDQLLNSDK